MSKMLIKAGKATALNWPAWKDFLITGLLLLISTALTYTIENIAKLDFGTFTGVIVPVATLVLKYLQSWIATFMTKEVEPSPTPNGPNFPVR